MQYGASQDFLCDFAVALKKVSSSTGCEFLPFCIVCFAPDLIKRTPKILQ